ncbi:MAG: threonine synthase [Burkholderiaceae bacterium]
MFYQSTRSDGAALQPFSDVLLAGLAPDGGLMVPQEYPLVDDAVLSRWRDLSYPDLAFEILSLYATDLKADDLRAMIARAYNTEVFGDEAITPVSRLDDDLHILHLSNGPTLAFKDIAMQLLGQLFEHVLNERGQQLNILGATSGDTGSAAEYAMRGRKGVRVIMLSPSGRMSEFQRAQMFSLLDDNIHNIAVAGVFDDCQDMVKAISGDLAFKKRYAIGAVNSINWARIVAQVVYYFKAYFAVTENNAQKISFAVPSGNFGNVLAGHIARSMGLPVERLVVATNENDVLDEFFKSGVYRVRSAAQTQATSSPSMDISKASNFERFVFDLLGRDGQRLAALWREIDANGVMDLSATGEFAGIDRFGFASGRSTHADRLATIGDTYRRTGVLVDTHTADGLFVAEKYREPGVPMICLETALPVKFADTIFEATGIRPPAPAGLENLAYAVQRYTLMPASITALKAQIAEICAS